mmetsp:Transcript_97180/g.202958  ORF Transcript_97180/g.202958 Transcript_97180/m.202958 type:complete len:418 (-) Transcript_97180:50-1303(-)
MISPLQLWQTAMPAGKTSSLPPTAITFNPSPRSQPTSPRLDEQQMLLKTQGQFASQSKDLHRCREELKLAQAEIRGLRRQLATMPGLVRGPDGERWPVSLEEVNQLKGEVLGLKKELDERPSPGAYEALQIEVSQLRAQLHNQYTCDQLLAVVDSLKAELDLRPTTKAYDAVWADVERLRNELNARPTQAMLDQAQQQADAQRQRAEDTFSQKVAVESELASLRALLREEQIKNETLTRRNGNLSSDLATTKARQAAEGARWTNEILYARNTERQLLGSLNSARDEISKLSPANSPAPQSRPIMSIASSSANVVWARDTSRSLRVPTSAGSTSPSGATGGPATTTRSSPFLLTPRMLPRSSSEKAAAGQQAPAPYQSAPAVVPSADLPKWPLKMMQGESSACTTTWSTSGVSPRQVP